MRMFVKTVKAPGGGLVGELQAVYNDVVAVDGCDPVGPFTIHSELRQDQYIPSLYSLLFAYEGDGLSDEDGQRIADLHTVKRGNVPGITSAGRTGWTTLLSQDGKSWVGRNSDDDDDD